MFHFDPNNKGAIFLSGQKKKKRVFLKAMITSKLLAFERKRLSEKERKRERVQSGTRTVPTYGGKF